MSSNYICLPSQESAEHEVIIHLWPRIHLFLVKTWPCSDGCFEPPKLIAPDVGDTVELVKLLKEYSLPTDSKVAAILRDLKHIVYVYSNTEMLRVLRLHVPSK